MEFLDAFFEGGINMVSPLLLVVTDFMLLEVNDILGLTTYVIDGLTQYMNSVLFAAGVPAIFALGALFSGGGFGSHACTWGDATVLASAGSGIDNLEHVKTQLPYCFLGCLIAIIGYIIVSIFIV